jgi:hypothetical protein
MPPPDYLVDLLAEPFGPFLEEEALLPSVKSKPTKPLEIEDLLLECEGHIIGYAFSLGGVCLLTSILSRLDLTEGPYAQAMEQVPPRSLDGSMLHALPRKSRVCFKGVLSFSDLSGLTEAARDRISSDYCARLEFQGHTRTSKDLSSVLGKYRGDDIRFGVTIIGEKAKPVTYKCCRQFAMFSLRGTHCNSANDYPESLVLLSEPRFVFDLIVIAIFLLIVQHSGRTYVVASFGVLTWHFSRSYIFRYHTLSILARIAGLHPDVPLSGRTPKWFVDQYLDPGSDIWLPDYARWHRTLFDDEASDSDAGSDVERPDTTTVRVPIGETSRRPRHARIVHHSEIFSVLASHADWLVAEQKLHMKHKRILDVDAWEKWAKENVKNRSLIDEVAGPRWGVRDEWDGMCLLLVLDVPSSPLQNKLHSLEMHIFFQHQQGHFRSARRVAY